MTDELYTIERANAALPLVRSIAADIVRLEARIVDATRTFRRLKRSPDKPQLALNSAQQALADLVFARDECAAELAEIGVRLGDPATGICDFLAELDGVRVYLCWMPGEERIEFYHALDAGYAGRVPLPVPAIVS